MQPRDTRSPNRGGLVLLAMTLACVTTNPATSAFAQTRVSVIEEIIVTARKREENLLEVPESLTTFTAGMLERSNIRDLADIGMMVPNMYMGTRLDGYPNVSIRGLGAFGNTQGVGFYLDDVQIFSDASSRFGDLQRIEILKGPQGILYGGSNIGGAVKFVAERPDPAAVSGHLRLRAGQDRYLDAEAQVNVPLSESWAMRLFGFAETDDSYLRNPNSPQLGGFVNANSSKVGKREQYGIRATIAGDLSERLSMYAALRYNELDGPNNAWIRELDGNLEHPRIVDTSFNPRHERQTLAGSVELTLDLDAVTVTSITSFTDTDSDRETDLDISQEFILDLFRPERLEVFTQELRVSSSGTAPLQWQVGGYLLDYERDLNSELLVRGGFCFLDPGVCDPLPGPEAAELLVALPFELSRRKREQRAAFANAAYSFGDFEFSAGIRLDRWKSQRLNVDTGIAGSDSSTEVLLRASLSWMPDERNMVYGTISQGFEPGDFNLTNFQGENVLFGYDAEEATQYELGYKGRLLDDRVVLTAAVFFIDYQDRQFELQASDPSGGFVEGIINAGDSEQWGAEMDLQWLLAEHWTLSVGLGYVDAEWKRGAVSTVTGADLSGQTPPNNAKWSGTAALEFETTLDDRWRTFARAQLRYKGRSSTNSQFFDTPGDDFPAWSNPSFTVVDLSAGVSWDRWSLDLQIENVFNEKYYIDVQEFPSFAGSALPGSPELVVIGTLEQPRRLVASLRYDF